MCSIINLNLNINEKQKIIEAVRKNYRKTAVLALLGKDIDPGCSYDDIYGREPRKATERMLGEEVTELAPGIFQGKNSGIVIAYCHASTAAANALATLALNLTPPEKRSEIAKLVSDLLKAELDPLKDEDDDDP